MQGLNDSNGLDPNWGAFVVSLSSLTWISEGIHRSSDPDVIVFYLTIFLSI